MSLFRFGNYEKDIDFTDAVLIDQIEESDHKATESAKNLSPTGKTGDRIRALNKVYDTFFEEVLGKDALPLLFGESQSYQARVNAYNSFCEAIKDTTNSIYSGNVKKFTPNRQQRRHNNRR